ncbi:TetR-like C-terminal domain-containing protein [Rhodococcus sovatensis]|uniref:TetR-like C-terminal domain-containing protein n=1 Tax=Rhodococcus sovatensis TaxID=1805840 RepID=A0ABZ2PG41_9NOCA
MIFDALFARAADVAETLPSTGDLQRDLETLLEEAVVEISTQPRESLLRSLAARIQTDESTASEFHDRLLRPQLDVVHTLLRSGGARRVERTAELLLAPVFYRWFMRLAPMTTQDIASHVREVLRLAHVP